MSRSSRLYVGNLPVSIREQEVRDMFKVYGTIIDCKIGNFKNPPAFAFVEFSDERDAADAIKDKHRSVLEGKELRVEWSNPKPSERDRDRGDRDRRSRSRSRSRGRSRSRSRERRYRLPYHAEKKMQYGLIVYDLPRSCSWQDLKDFGKKIAAVDFADMISSDEGLITYSSSSAFEDAFDKLHKTEFRNRRDSSIVGVKKAIRDQRFSYLAPRRRSRSRSPSSSYSRSRSRSRSRSPRNDRRKKDQYRGRDRSRSVSRSEEGRDGRAASAFASGGGSAQAFAKKNDRSPSRSRSRSASVDK